MSRISFIAPVWRRIIYSALGVAFVSIGIFLILAFMRVDIKAHAFGRSVLTVCLASMGLTLFLLAFFTLAENHRRRSTGGPFLAMNRFGSWHDDSYWFSQCLNAAFLLMSLYLFWLAGVVLFF